MVVFNNKGKFSKNSHTMPKMKDFTEFVHDTAQNMKDYSDSMSNLNLKKTQRYFA